MKKLLLLSAFLIFACSDDDSSDTNDNSNQTFLEIYGNTKWEIINGEDCLPNDKLKFSNSDLFLTFWQEAYDCNDEDGFVDEICYTIENGQEFIYPGDVNLFDKYSIEINNPDFLSIKWEFKSGSNWAYHSHINISTLPSGDLLFQNYSEDINLVEEEYVMSLVNISFPCE